MWTVNDLDYLGTLQRFREQFNANDKARKLVKNWNRLILLCAKDTGSKYGLVVKDNEMVEVRPARPADDGADDLVHLEADESVLKDIFSGRYNPATALLDGALAVFSLDRDKVKLEALAMVIWRLG
jgi:putative sterol carrier protein